jgi:hypothetical protein
VPPVSKGFFFLGPGRIALEEAIHTDLLFLKIFSKLAMAKCSYLDNKDSCTNDRR